MGLGGCPGFGVGLGKAEKEAESQGWSEKILGDKIVTDDNKQMYHMSTSLQNELYDTVFDDVYKGVCHRSVPTFRPTSAHHVIWATVAASLWASPLAVSALRFHLPHGDHSHRSDSHLIVSLTCSKAVIAFPLPSHSPSS